MWRRRTRTTELDVTRRRMIIETEIGLLIGLRFPERTPRIPTVHVGSGSFDPRFARAFWEEALGDLSGIEHLVDRVKNGELIADRDVIRSETDINFVSLTQHEARGNCVDDTRRGIELFRGNEVSGLATRDVDDFAGRRWQDRKSVV